MVQHQQRLPAPRDRHSRYHPPSGDTVRRPGFYRGCPPALLLAWARARAVVWSQWWGDSLGERGYVPSFCYPADGSLVFGTGDC